MMGIFSQHFDALQNSILGREYDASVTSICGCGMGPAYYRCEECFILQPSCKTCLVDSHHHAPLHHVQEWTGTHFMRKSLCELGMIICLGHYSRRCPNAPLGSTGRSTVIINTNGIHNTKVLYCCCASAPGEPFQLTSAGLFPATIDQPETAFTFAILDDFDVHALASKKSAYDHFIALRKHTNGAFPHLSHVSHHHYIIFCKLMGVQRIDTRSFCEFHGYGHTSHPFEDKVKRLCTTSIRYYHTVVLTLWPFIALHVLKWGSMFFGSSLPACLQNKGLLLLYTVHHEN